MAVRASLTASAKARIDGVHLGWSSRTSRFRGDADLPAIFVIFLWRTLLWTRCIGQMGNCFVGETAFTLWDVCAIDFAQVVVQVESTRSKTGKCFRVGECNRISDRCEIVSAASLLHNDVTVAERELSFRILASNSWRFAVPHFECRILQF